MYVWNVPCERNWQVVMTQIPMEKALRKIRD